jgi:hypothetical protein
VAEPDKFPVGTGVHVLDSGAGGFYTTVATVVGRDGDRLLLSRMLNHDYHARKNARAVSVFPVVEGDGIHDNAGTGLHPGSGSVRYLMQDNRVHDNSECGVFYCLRTTHSICRRNELRGNGRQGISIGERDTDHRIEGNEIAGNAEEGVLWRGFTYRGGDRVVLTKNEIASKGAKGKRSQVALAGGLCDVCVLDNTSRPGGRSTCRCTSLTESKATRSSSSSRTSTTA